MQQLTDGGDRHMRRGMEFNFVRSDEVAKIKSRLKHPVLDTDGHLIEFLPLVFDIVEREADKGVAQRLREIFDRVPTRPTSTGVSVGSSFPAARLDFLTVAMPSLLYQRLDELGIDFAVLYPTLAFSVMEIPDDELRQAVVRSMNIYYRELYDDSYRDRLEPVAVIPTFSPEEALSELEHAVCELGFKSIVMTGGIPRSVDRNGDPREWRDQLGHESLFDYGPVWARCAELGVVPTFHGRGDRRGSRRSASNFTYNHVGHFASAQEAVCRSLFMGGVLRTFPQLPFAFLEGGVGWAAQLFADLVSHFGKRNHAARTAFRQTYLDDGEVRALLAQYSEGRIANSATEIADKLYRPKPDDPLFDDFTEAHIDSAEQIRDVFANQLYFGCEADDPLASLAFNTKSLPFGATLRPILGTDIGHWDVQNIRDILVEAWELVEDDQIDEDQFRDFAFGNGVRMLTSLNPNYFDNTVLRDEIGVST
jgi:predicted TIM-barrel fold metal-dependent hydrolase